MDWQKGGLGISRRLTCLDGSGTTNVDDWRAELTREWTKSGTMVTPYWVQHFKEIVVPVRSGVSARLALHLHAGHDGKDDQTQNQLHCKTCKLSKTGRKAKAKDTD